MTSPCTLGINGGTALDLGTLLSATDSLSTGAKQIAIVTLPADQAYCMDYGGSESLSLSFERECPHPYNNSSTSTADWSNAYWVQRLVAIIDRWQFLTDGNTFTFAPEGTFAPAVSLNVYVSNIKYTTGPDSIAGSIQLKAGTAYI